MACFVHGHLVQIPLQFGFEQLSTVDHITEAITGWSRYCICAGKVGPDPINAMETDI